MRKNQIQWNSDIRARVFEYAVNTEQKDLANEMLVKLSKEKDELSSGIDKDYLKDYFNQSLKTDNFDGIAYLTNYC